jgi:nucleoside-diphosphate kinase
MKEQTLVLIKPDGVQRAIAGRILQRFEDAGLKVVGMKMVHVNKEKAEKHYFDVAERVSEKVFQANVNFLVEGPVLAFVLEGIQAIETVRKMVGGTEPKTALPGTIRGDFAHQSYEWCDANNQVIRNLIHASASSGDAKREIELWFKPEELHLYTLVHEKHTIGKE